MTRVAANGLEFEVELDGPADAPVVLLIMGLGMQMTAWPAALLADLRGAGYRTLIFDQRDTGLSSRITAKGQPSFAWAFLKRRVGLAVRPPYTIADMAEDALAIATCLKVTMMHVVGVSMGGMIAQHVAVRAPERVASLCLMMSTSGANTLPGASKEVTRVMLGRMPAADDEEALVERFVRMFSVIGSPGYRTDASVMRATARASVRRAVSPDGTVRQMLAILCDGDRSTLLPNITAATLVIHGRADPLLPLACGEDLAQKIPGARLVAIDGMGHDLPDPLLPALGQQMIEHFRAARV